MKTGLVAVGLIILFVSMGFYFLYPFYHSEGDLFGMTYSISYSLSTLNGLCSSALISVMSGQGCDQVRFFSYGAYIIAGIGGLIVIKGFLEQ